MSNQIPKVCLGSLQSSEGVGSILELFKKLRISALKMKCQMSPSATGAMVGLIRNYVGGAASGLHPC